jgi:germination protein M
MNRKFIIMLAVIIIGICLLSGGCSTFAGDNSLQVWKELLSIDPDEPEKEKVSDKNGTSLEELLANQTKKEDVADTAEYLTVTLYYADADGTTLAAEEREIVKTEGIARKTLEELFKGPQNAKYSNVFPKGLKLLDINIKEDGSCVVDLSSEARQAKSAAEEELLVYAIVNTLGEFPTVERVSFLISGEQVDTISGHMDLSQPVEPDYSK